MRIFLLASSISFLSLVSCAKSSSNSNLVSVFEKPSINKINRVFSPTNTLEAPLVTMTCSNLQAYEKTKGFVVNYDIKNNAYTVPKGCKLEKLYTAKAVLSVFHKIKDVTQKDLTDQDMKYLKSVSTGAIVGSYMVVSGFTFGVYVGSLGYFAVMSGYATAGELILWGSAATGTLTGGLVAYNKKDQAFSLYGYNSKILFKKKIYDMLQNPHKHFDLTLQEGLDISMNNNYDYTTTFPNYNLSSTESQSLDQEIKKAGLGEEIISGNKFKTQEIK